MILAKTKTQLLIWWAGMAWAFASGLPAAAAAPHYVFAHYMVCYATYGDYGADTNSTIAGYKRDIQEAQAAGIDGFALNLNAYNDPTQPYYNSRVAEIYEAAEQLGTGFKLFFSVNFAGESNIVNLVETYGRRTNTFTYEGKIVLSAYGGNDVPSAGWPGVDWTNSVLGKLKQDGYGIYFVPFFFSDPVSEIPQSWCAAEVISNFGGIVDGLFCWTAAGLPTQLAPANAVYTFNVHNLNKLSMAGIAPHYWGSVQNSLGRRYYETDGGEGLIRQWLGLIQNQPDWVEICTWNDFNESTYISPVDNPQQYFPDLATPHRYSHKGYLELSKPYISWFKKGYLPAITNDAMFYFYRSHPMNLTASNTNDIGVTWRSGDMADQIYITTWLTAPAEVLVNSGGVLTTNATPSGFSSFRVSFTAGPQYFTLSRQGTILAATQGPDIASQITNYDFFPASGFVYGPNVYGTNNSTVSPPTNLRAGTSTTTPGLSSIFGSTNAGTGVPSPTNVSMQIIRWLDPAVGTFADQAGTKSATNGQAIRLWKDSSINHFDMYGQAGNSGVYALRTNGIPIVQGNGSGGGTCVFQNAYREPCFSNVTVVIAFSMALNSAHNGQTFFDEGPQGASEVDSLQLDFNDGVFYAGANAFGCRTNTSLAWYVISYSPPNYGVWMWSNGVPVACGSQSAGTNCANGFTLGSIQGENSGFDSQMSCAGMAEYSGYPTATDLLILSNFWAGRGIPAQ